MKTHPSIANKLKVINSYLRRFKVVETPDGLFKAQLEYGNHIIFFGDCVCNSDMIDEVYEHLNDEIRSWLCVPHV